MRDSADSACRECGFQNNDDARYCERCGVGLQARCPGCEATVRAGQNFCGRCGQPLGVAHARAPRVQTPQHLAEQIPGNLGPGVEGERKFVTILFADVAGSTALIKDLDAEEANRILGPAVEIMARVIHRYEGVIREEGDGVMASFGAPIAHEDHAVRACCAAVELLEALRDHAAFVRSVFGMPLLVRVGINSGPVVVKARRPESGAVDLRLDGVPVHIGKRLEALAPPGKILLTRETRTLVEGYVRTGPLEAVTIRGIDGRIEVCELEGVTTRLRIQALAVRGLSRFVGRRIELELLDAAAEQARSGQGQLVALVGEAGVGKSRMFLEFTRSFAMQGWLVLEAGSVSYGKATSYLPLIDLLNRYFEIQGRDDEQRTRERIAGKLLPLGEEKLLAQMTLFLGALGLAASEHAWNELTPSERQRQLFDALRHLLIRESQKQPLCLVFEDLHWIDAETEAFLDLLVASIPGARVLVLVNCRPEYGLRWAGKSYCSQAHVHPLPAANAVELLDVLLGADADLTPIKERLIEVTEGNPLFIEESVRSLIENGVLAGTPGRWRPAGTLPASFVPQRIEALLAERIDRLQREPKETLQCAAVIGNDVPRALLEAVMDLAGAQLDRVLRELQASEFLYEKTLFPETVYTFKHAMTREVAYNSLLTERRVFLHGRAARGLEAVAASRLDEHIERLAEHAERGCIWDKAVEYLRRSGAKAYALYANAEAARFFERSLIALGHLPAGRERLEQAVDLRFELRNALLALGETDRILQCLREIEAPLDTLGDPLRKARYASFRCNFHFLAGEQRTANAYGVEGLNLAHECGDRPVTGELLYRVGQTYHALGQYRKAIALLEQSLEYTGEVREKGRFDLIVIPAVVSRTWLVAALVEYGDFGAGMIHAKRALDIAKAADHPLSEALGWLATGQLLLRKGEFDGAVGALEMGLGLSDKWSLRVWRPRLASALAVACARTGHTGKALELARQGLAEVEVMRQEYDRAQMLLRLGQVCMIAGQAAEAIALGKAAVETARAREARGDEAWARFLIARACCVLDPRDDGETARRELDLVLRLATECEAQPLIAFCNTALGAVHDCRGDQTAAQGYRAGARAIYDKLGMRPLPVDPVR